MSPRILRRLAIGLSVAIALAVALLAALPSLAPGIARAAARRSTGADLAIADVDVSYRAGTVVVRDVVLKTPAGEEVVAIGEIRATVRRFAPGDRVLELASLEIDSPRIVAEIDADGRVRLPGIRRPEKPPRLIVDRLRIRDGSIRLRDRAGGGERALDLIRIDLDAASFPGPEPTFTLRFAARDVVSAARVDGHLGERGEVRVRAANVDLARLRPWLESAGLRPTAITSAARLLRDERGVLDLRIPVERAPDGRPAVALSEAIGAAIERAATSAVRKIAAPLGLVEPEPAEPAPAD